MGFKNPGQHLSLKKDYRIWNACVEVCIHFFCTKKVT